MLVGYFIVAVLFQGDGYTAVPMISGDFIAAHRAKCARFSASVRLPFPTSSMSGSLWPQKSTEFSSKLLRLAMVEMRGQFARKALARPYNYFFRRICV